MIELELKFALKNTKFNDVIANQATKRKSQCDIYYDTIDGKLFCNGNFLRVRDSKRIDFKLYAGDDTHNYCEETTYSFDSFHSKNKNLCSLLLKLGFNQCDLDFLDFYDFCNKFNLVQLVIIQKERTTCQFDDLIISFDDVEHLGTFLEIERDFENSDFDLENEKIKLRDAAVELGILDLNIDQPVSIGYVELYLKKFNYSLYLKGKYIG